MESIHFKPGNEGYPIMPFDLASLVYDVMISITDTGTPFLRGVWAAIAAQTPQKDMPRFTHLLTVALITTTVSQPNWIVRKGHRMCLT